MKKIIPLIILGVLFFGCQKKNTNGETKSKATTSQPAKAEKKSEVIYIKTITGGGTTTDSKVDNVVSQLSSDTFEISLKKMVVPTERFLAQKEVESFMSEDKTTFNYIYVEVTDQEGNRKFFKTKKDFFNFATSAGYELISEKTKSYGFDCAFKKTK